MEEEKREISKTKTVKQEETVSKKEFDALQQQMALLLQQFEQNKINATANQTPSYNSTYFDGVVKIIHLVGRASGLSTVLNLSNLKIRMTNFGEERTLSLQQFEEAVGNYRSFFEQGIVAISSESEELAAHYGLQTIGNYPMNSEFVKNLGILRMEQIETIYPKLPQAGKDFVIGHWKRKAYSGEQGFADRSRIETLNRISNGAMQDLISTLEAQKNRSNSKK